MIGVSSSDRVQPCATIASALHLGASTIIICRLFSSSQIRNLETMANELVTEASQMNKQLAVNGQGMLRRSGPHFSETLPGQPRVRLDQPELYAYLRGAFLVPDLDALAGILWLASNSVFE
jgi:hypothetical protein